MVVPSFTNATCVHLFKNNEVGVDAETGVPTVIKPSDQEACKAPLFVMYNEGLLFAPEYPKNANQFVPVVPVIISAAPGLIHVSIVKFGTD